MKRPACHTIDFETEKIQNRPVYPPVPVSVAIKEYGKSPVFMSWGHPCDNNCTKQEARKKLLSLYKSDLPAVFHNAKFDLDVGETHLDLPLIPRKGYHDTEFLAFLFDPHASKLSLKPLAEKHLDMPPDEQTHLKNWILTNVVEAKRKPNEWGAYISKAPGNLVGKYAKGDVIRTWKLFEFYWKRVVIELGMLEPYQRELAVMPILLKNERRGVKVGTRILNSDLKLFEKNLEVVDQDIRRRLKVKELDVDSNEQMADALEKAGKIGDWVYTDKGNRSISKDNLPLAINDKQLLAIYQYRSKLTNGVRNFLRPWSNIAKECNGFIHTNWNQVRNTDERGKSSAGARTGRLSSNPNFQNPPKQPPEIILPKVLIDKLPLKKLPYPREYIIPDDKQSVLLQRDWSQQELRILGYFEGGPLYQSWLDKPEMDLHEEARMLVSELVMIQLERKPIKNLAFGLLYGMGLALTADKMGVDIGLAKTIKKAYLGIFPGLKTLLDDLKRRAKDKEPMRTWGGRLYWCEEPLLKETTIKPFGKEVTTIMKVIKSFEYKMINYLIQGSAADVTKQGIINTDAAVKDSQLLLTVHDEFIFNSPAKASKQEMKRIREAMMDIDMGGIQMLSDGKMSNKSWALMKKFKD
jgi:DNA polymerase I-like protein with 3'-5' exonuclease and polymerase domains